LPQPLADIPRVRFGLLMLLASVLGVFVAGLVGWFKGGADAAGIAAVAVFIGALASFIPTLPTIPRDYWGLSVVCSGMARNIVILIAAHMLIGEDSPRRAIAAGAVAGGVAMLAVEAVTAIRLLSAMHRQAPAHTPTGPGQSPRSAEHTHT
jgi:hypothetical protein